MNQLARRLPILLLSLFSFQALLSQPLTKENRPYKILTAGRQLTFKGTKPIRHIMVWTSDGHRIVEQREINDTQIRVDIPVARQTYYVMVEMIGGKRYTERIGVQ